MSDFFNFATVSSRLRQSCLKIIQRFASNEPVRQTHPSMRASISPGMKLARNASPDRKVCSFHPTRHDSARRHILGQADGDPVHLISPMSDDNLECQKTVWQGLDCLISVDVAINFHALPNDAPLPGKSLTSSTKTSSSTKTLRGPRLAARANASTISLGP